ALGHREAETGEDRDDLVLHAGQRMERAPRGPAARQREIDTLAAALGGTLGIPRRLETTLEKGLELALGLVGGGADQRPLGGWQRAQRPQQLRQLTLAAEKANADLLQLGGGARGGGGPARLLEDRVDARVSHRYQRASGGLSLGSLGELGEGLGV